MDHRAFGVEDGRLATEATVEPSITLSRNQGAKIPDRPAGLTTAGGTRRLLGLPHDSQRSPACAIRLPRIHPRPTSRQTSSRGPLAKCLDHVARSDRPDSFAHHRCGRPHRRCRFWNSEKPSGITKSSFGLPSGSLIRSSVSTSGISMSSFATRADRVLGEIRFSCGSASGGVLVEADQA